jgi:amino acid transporter
MQTYNGKKYFKSLYYKLIGPPKEIRSSSLFHEMSLVPVLAWIGLSADGLSSSAYGPEEAYKALGSHVYLVIFLSIATALTVFIISYAYTRIIEHFPHGGGGYIVSTHLLGNRAGLVSGSALLVDYILTITVSIASCSDAVFSYLPVNIHILKLPFACFLIIVLIILNLRGVKESIIVLAPIFLVFIITHLMLMTVFFTHTDKFLDTLSVFPNNLRNDMNSIGIFGILALFLRAYSIGGGTYTGIEAVSNGLQIIREPRVENGKKTMAYLAISLAMMSVVLFLCYLIFDIRPIKGQTLNATLFSILYGNWRAGYLFSFIAILSEGLLLIVAAQTGFVDGPRVMANMAIDSWFPHRFASLSNRLTIHNGIMLMGSAALMLLLYTEGSTSMLIIMYSINVFITFSLSELGMSKFWIKNRHKDRKWKKHIMIHLTGFILCMTILIITIFEKFTIGGWMSIMITSFVLSGCYLIHRHYMKINVAYKKLDKVLIHVPKADNYNPERPDPNGRTAIQLVSDYNGFGIHTLLSMIRNFPNLYKNIIFISVAVVDSGAFKGAEEISALEKSTKSALQRYVELAQSFGLASDYRVTIATDVVESAANLCRDIIKEFPRSTVFTGHATFKYEKFYHRLLHNETAFAIQRNLQWEGITTVILPIRVRI